MKTCPKCNVDMPRDAFSKHAKRPDGLQDQCKACFRAYYLSRQEDLKQKAREWYGANRERSLAATAKWQRANKDRANARKARWLAGNPQKRKEASKRYHEATSEYQKTRGRKWVKENPGKVAAKSKRYAQSHREVKRAVDARRSGRVRANGGSLSQGEWQGILRDALGLCVYCHRPRKLTLEHVEPISRGGAHEAENIAAACKSCNSSKNDTPLVLWLAKRRVA